MSKVLTSLLSNVYTPSMWALIGAIALGLIALVLDLSARKVKQEHGELSSMYECLMIVGTTALTLSAVLLVVYLLIVAFTA